MGSVITAGLKSLVADLAANTATAKGNVLKGLKGLRDKGVVKKAFRSMAMVGLTTSILGGAASAHPNTDIISELTNRVITATTKSMLYAATGIVIGGEKPSKALQSAYKSAIAHTLCSTMAGRLGKAYHAGNLPDGIVEALHGVVGALNAKIMDEDALSGAIGAITGEITGKVYRNANPEKFGDNGHKVNDLERDETVSFATDLAKITAAAVATAMNLDPNTAIRTAEIAAVNNAYGMYHTTGKLFDQQGEPLKPEEVEAAVDTVRAILTEIRDNPEAFFMGCADIGTNMIIPGGNKHVKNLLNGKEDLTTFATNQKRSIGEEVAMGMVVGGKIAKGSKHFRKIVKYVDGKYQAKLAQIKNFTQKQKLQQTRKRYDIDGKKFQIHHIISDKNQHVKDHPLWEKAGMIPDDYVMFLPTKKGAKVTTTKRSVHDGRHLDSISENHKEVMNNILEIGKGNNWNQSQYKQAFEKLISSERKLLKEGKIKLNKNHIGTD